MANIELTEKLNRTSDRILSVAKYAYLFNTWEEFRNEVANDLSEGDAFLAWKAGEVLQNKHNG